MPVVGRHQELTALDAAHADALAGRGGLVVVRGAAGIGKTAERSVREDPMLPNLVLLAACATPDTVAPDGAAPAPVDELMLVDVGALPVKWTAAPGWFLFSPHVVPDVTGDGIDDGIVNAQQTGDLPVALLVEGPLRRTLTLPGDELASFPSAGHLQPIHDMEQGDATGDGVADLVMSDGEGFYLLSGPFIGVVSPAMTGAPLLGLLADVDGDGVLDRWTPHDLSVEITWGPASRWSGGPDLDVDASCGSSSTVIDHLRAYPDVDGDGRREVWIDADEVECANWLFPLPTTSPYEPASDRAAVKGLLGPMPIGDQTGDGVGDLWTWNDRTVHPVPVTLANPITSSNPIHAPADLLEVHPIPYDLDADGLTEFLAVDAEIDTSEVRTSVGAPIDEVTGEQMVLLPGGALLASPVYATLWDIDGRVFQPDGVFLEDGIVSVLVGSASVGSEVIVVDLGPGTAP